MQNILTHIDAFLTKLGPVTHVLDAVAVRILPKANAQAVCVFCGHPYCSSAPCQFHPHPTLQLQDCFDNCTHEQWTNTIGCYC